MKRRSLILMLAAAPLTVRAEDKMPVMATFSILADMVSEIGGDEISVASLVPVDADTHHFQPKPSDLRKLQTAQLLVINGLGLEGWMSRMVKTSGYAGPVVVATAGITPLKIADQRGRATTQTDPHAWQDLRNGIIYVRNLTAGLVKANPARAEMYRARADDYVRRIAETDQWIEQHLAAVPVEKRKVITSHDAFGYFGARYRITFRGVAGIDTDAEPSAADVAALVKQIKREGIKAVFVENMTDPRLAQIVARESGAILGGTIYSDALSPPGGPADTYLKMFRHNVPLLVAAMQAN